MNIWSTFSQRQGLSEDENRVYRNFNIFLSIGLLDLIVVGGALSNLQPAWPFYMCLIEFVLFCCMLLLHINGYLLSARYITFLLATVLQTMASITHGKAGGFDYLFFVICVLPMMFFESRRHYISLFVISLSAYLAVQYSFHFTSPIIIIDSDFPLYWNTFVTASILFGVMFAFKRGYQRTQVSLQKKNDQITHQKEEIETINNNLEKLIVQRTEKVLEHEKLFVEYANINAHKVRSPLARILGLLNLIELESDKEKSTKEFLPILKSNAEDLNTILDEVSHSLNAINTEKDFSAPKREPF